MIFQNRKPKSDILMDLIKLFIKKTQNKMIITPRYIILYKYA